MSPRRKDFSQIGFLKLYVLPALLVFLVPVLSCLFFYHARARYDANIRERLRERIRSDTRISNEERAKSLETIRNVRFSQMLENPEFAKNVDGMTRFYYATFRWMIRLSILSVLAGAGVFMLVGLCVLLSLQSQRAQYLGLSAGWHVLRIFGAFQAVAQGLLLVALSFWVTALWFQVYSVKLILLTGILAVIAVGALLAAIFKKPDMEFVIEGIPLDHQAAQRLWDDLQAICEKVGTAPPDQVLAGIDDNFFVTEHPVTAGGRTYTGRTLYVSLCLLKQLDGAEADGVMAHEMAHFSGQDTTYSRKISPLLVRYANYLQALGGGFVTLPIFYFMVGFRALYQLSLGRLNQKRELRADRIASESVSKAKTAGALLRIAACSRYRAAVEQRLFEKEQVLEQVNIAGQIEQGFPAYAQSFAAKEDIGNLETAHPFDSHPPLQLRLEALGVPMEASKSLLSSPGDGRWYARIEDAARLERQQWDRYEEKFRQFHQQSLAYRYLPATPEERSYVERSFPPISFDGEEGSFSIDFEKLSHAKWHDSIYFREISNLSLKDGVLKVTYDRSGKQTRTVTTKKLGDRQQGALQALQRYYSRHATAHAYHQAKQQAKE